MAVQIEINEAHIDALVNFYIQRIKVLRDEIVDREKELKEINTQILKLKKGKTSSALTTIQTEPLIQSVPYSDKWPWVKKVQFALETQGRPLTTKEIVDTLIEHEIGLMFDRKKAVASISSMLSTKSGQGKEFVRVESPSGDFAYDLNKNEVMDPTEEDQSESIGDEESVNPFD